MLMPAGILNQMLLSSGPASRREDRDLLVLRKPVGQHASGTARPDDHVIIVLAHPIRHCVEDNHFNDIYGARLEEAGYVVVGRLDIGNEYIWSKDPVTQASDLAGVKISSPIAPSMARMLESTGASVVSLGGNRNRAGAQDRCHQWGHGNRPST